MAKNEPKKVDVKNPVFLYIEGAVTCQEGTLEIQQQDDFEDDKWHHIRIPYEEVPELIKALKSKLPEVTGDNYKEWDVEVFNRTD